MESKDHTVIGSDKTDLNNQVKAGSYKRTGKKPAIVAISEAERTELEALTRKTTAPVAYVQRAKIALLCADRFGKDEISTMVGVSGKMVSKRRQRFSLFGTSVLEDARRSGIPRKHSDDKIAEILHLTHGNDRVIWPHLAWAKWPHPNN